MATSKRPSRVSRAQYIEAIHDARGFLTAAADSLGVTVSAIYKARDRDPEIRQAIWEARERTADFAEAALLKLIREGNPTGIIFYLKTQGRARGYVERTEQHLTLHKPLSEMTDDELDDLEQNLTD